MFSSVTVSVLFTVLFAATGCYALHRLSARVSGTDPGADRVTESAHLLMSVAMIAMTWGWTGGAGSAGGGIQIVVFGLYSLWFLTGTIGGSLPDGLHLVNTAAMTWMVVAMPQLMGGAGGHGMSGTVTAVTLLVTVLLAAVAGVWAVRALTRAAPAEEYPATPLGAGGASVRVAVPVAASRCLTRRLDASCHTVMSMGMAAMFVAML